MEAFPADLQSRVYSFTSSKLKKLSGLFGKHLSSDEVEQLIRGVMSPGDMAQECACNDTSCSPAAAAGRGHNLELLSELGLKLVIKHECL